MKTDTNNFQGGTETESSLLYERGLGMLESGDWYAAIGCFERAVAMRPENPDYLKCLGNAYRLSGHNDEALGFYQKALAIDAAYTPALYNIAKLKAELGRADEALELLRRLLAIDAMDTDAIVLMADIHESLGHKSVACGYYHDAFKSGRQDDYVLAKLIALTDARPDLVPDVLVRLRTLADEQPGNGHLYFYLGLLHERRGDIDDAVENYRECTECASPMVEAWVNLGAIELRKGVADSAEACFLKALAMDPTHQLANCNLGYLMLERGESVPALAHFDAAEQVGAGSAFLAVGKGMAYQEMGRFEESIHAYKKALSLDPENSGINNNLGNVYQLKEEYKTAITYYQEAMRLDGNNYRAVNNLGNAYHRLGEFKAARDSYKRALEINPEFYCALENYLQQCQQTCHWEDIDHWTGRLRQLSNTSAQAYFNPFPLLTIDTSLAEQQNCAKRYFQSKAQGCTPLCVDSSRLRVDGNGKLRIGYLSADFRNHAVSHLMAELFELHDRSKFELVAYSYGPDDKSAIRRRVMNAFDRFVDIRHEFPSTTARRIHSDGIHILVDLSGYTEGCRPQILAYKPAPLQINYLGYPGTMGSPLMDYIIADGTLISDMEESYYSEKILYMPHSYQVNDRKRPLPGATSRSAHGLPEHSIVFCCINQAYKILPPIFEAWMGIMTEVPGSVLWLLECNTLAKESLRSEAEKFGVDPGRVLFAPKLNVPEHISRLALADIFLDTYPYNAHTSASDALWAGVPVVTLRGKSFASRVASSLLKAVGLNELCVDSLEDYRKLAVDLARNKQNLAAIKKRLVDERDGQPLFDTPRFVSALENGYREIWLRYQQGLPPATLHLT